MMWSQIVISYIFFFFDMQKYKDFFYQQKTISSKTERGRNLRPQWFGVAMFFSNLLRDLEVWGKEG